MSSRERAQALILAGRVLVEEQKLEKAGASVDENVNIRLLGNDLPYVSRGGLKLARALEHWQIDVTSKTCIDWVPLPAASPTACCKPEPRELSPSTPVTGRWMYACAAIPRVRLLEKTNARYLTLDQLWGDATPEPIGLSTMDVSFISATLVLPAVLG